MKELLGLINGYSSLELLMMLCSFLLLIMIFYFVVCRLSETKKGKKKPELLFFCQNRNKYLPIIPENMHLEYLNEKRPEYEGDRRQIILKCECGEHHVIDIRTKYTGIPTELRRKKLRLVKLP